jgi:hypothetical protein
VEKINDMELGSAVLLGDREWLTTELLTVSTSTMSDKASCGKSEGGRGRESLDLPGGIFIERMRATCGDSRERLQRVELAEDVQPDVELR